MYNTDRAAQAIGTTQTESSSSSRYDTHTQCSSSNMYNTDRAAQAIGTTHTDSSSSDRYDTETEQLKR